MYYILNKGTLSYNKGTLAYKEDNIAYGIYKIATITILVII